MDTPQTRLKAYIKQYFNTNREFCEQIGMHENTLTKYIGESAASIIGKKYLNKLSKLGLNIGWYLTGNGNMVEARENISNINSTIQTLPAINHNKQGVPFYPIDITAGLTDSFDDIAEIPEFYVDYRPLNDCDAYFPVYGDSMYPMFKSGDVIAVKRIPTLEIILWGEPYFVITSPEIAHYKTIKLLYPDPNSKDNIILKGSNPSFTDNIIVSKAHIIGLFVIKGKVTKYMI